MTRTQRAGWALTTVGILVFLAGMIVQVSTAEQVLALTLTFSMPITAAGLGLLGFGYRDLVMPKREGD